MPYFRIDYRYRNRQNAVTVRARSRGEALEFFQKESPGIPLRVEEVSKPLRVRWEEWKHRIKTLGIRRRVKSEPYIAALRQIGIMVDAGMPINFALEETILFTQNSQLKTIFRHILQEIENGKSLSESARPYTGQLGELSLSMFYLGEQSGTLSDAILKLADILEQIENNRRMLKKATRYPLFIIVAMMIAFGIVITMVVPQFQQLFAEAKVELPFPTRFLLWIEGATVRYGPYILGGAFLLSTLYGILYRKSAKVRLHTDRMMLRIYIVGEVIRYAMLGRFVYVFRVLLEAGVPIIQALETAVGVVDNRWIRYRLQRIFRAINEGRSLYEGFLESDMFERIIVQMVKTGEDGGALGTMLDKASRYYTDRYQYIVDNIATMIEPILITAIAGFVLILALGIFLPMWNMVSMVG